jgi:hypothetical protein
MSPARRKAKGQGRDKPARMILFLGAGLAIATLVLWSLITAGPTDRGAGGSGGEPPSGEIGDASREQLREILRQADDVDRPGAR